MARNYAAIRADFVEAVKPWYGKINLDLQNLFYLKAEDVQNVDDFLVYTIVPGVQLETLRQVVFNTHEITYTIYRKIPVRMMELDLYLENRNEQILTSLKKIVGKINLDPFSWDLNEEFRTFTLTQTLEIS